jgi:hypothetical protein
MSSDVVHYHYQPTEEGLLYCEKHPFAVLTKTLTDPFYN